MRHDRHGDTRREGRERGRPAGEEAETPDLLMPGMLEMVSERDLCVLWRRCQREIEAAADARARDQFERLRGDCLAELERRNPAAIAAWLAGGPSTADDLERFVDPGAEQTTFDAT